MATSKNLDQPERSSLLVAAHTNKNWFGLKKDIEKAIAGTNIKMVVDQAEVEKGTAKRSVGGNEFL